MATSPHSPALIGTVGAAPRPAGAGLGPFAGTNASGWAPARARGDSAGASNTDPTAAADSDPRPGDSHAGDGSWTCHDQRWPSHHRSGADSQGSSYQPGGGSDGGASGIGGGGYRRTSRSYRAPPLD